MQTRVTATSYAGLAAYIAQLANEGPGVNEELVKKAHHLVRYFITNFGSLFSPSFCTSIAQIPFVPVPTAGLELAPLTAAEMNMSMMNGNRNGNGNGNDAGSSSSSSANHTLVSFSAAALARDWHLVFTVLPVLPQDLTPPQIAWASLSIKQPISYPIIEMHLQNLSEETLDRWSFGSEHRIEDSFKKILGYLESQFDTLNADQQRRLRGFSLVPVGTRLVRASQLFFYLDHDLAPFVFRVPKFLVNDSTRSLLERLGTAEGPTAAAFVRILRDLALDEFRGLPLSAYELSGVVKMLQLITRDEAAGRHHHQDGAGAVFLPDARAVLMPANECLYVDSPHVLARINADAVSLVHPFLSTDMCRRLGIVPLSEEVEERLVTPTGNDNATTLTTQEHQQMEALLHSDELHQVLVQVLEHVSIQQHGRGGGGGGSGNHSHTGGGGGGAEVAGAPGMPPVSRSAVRKWKEQLAMVKLQPLQQLVVQFVLRRSGRNVSKQQHLHGSDNEGGPLVHVAKHVLYIKHPLPATTQLADVVALGVVAYLGLSDMDAARIAPLLRAASIGAQPQEATAALPTILRDLHLAAATPADAHAVPQIGGPLTVNDRDLAVLRPLHRFEQGEWAAVPAVRADGSTVWKLERGAREHLRYVLVQSCSAPMNNLQKLSVVFGPDPGDALEIVSSEVYMLQSCRTSQRNGGSSSIRTAPAPTAPTPATTAPSAASTSSAGAGAVASPAGTAAPQMEATDFVGALRELCMRANLPLDLQSQRLVERNMVLNKQVEETATALAAAQTELERASQAAEEAQAATTCGLCYQNKINTLLIPCGHAVCSSCAGSLHRDCPYCRQAVQSRSRIYLNGTGTGT